VVDEKGAATIQFIPAKDTRLAVEATAFGQLNKPDGLILLVVQWLALQLYQLYLGAVTDTLFFGLGAVAK
jgi:hypothetical protein